MKNITANILRALCLLATGWLIASCSELEDTHYAKGTAGMVKLNLQLYTPEAEVITSRASNLDALMSEIDNVHVLIFNSNDSIVYRHYLNYGEEQNIFLLPANNYRLFIVANLDATNTNIGNAEAFFDDVYTLTELREKYIIVSSRSVEQLGKITMTSNGLISANIPGSVGNQVTMRIPMKRVKAKVIFNIYNKVVSQTDKTVASGVYPISWNSVNMPVSSFLVERENNELLYPGGTFDHPMNGTDDTDIATHFNMSAAEMLPSLETTTVQYKNNWYTKQSFSLFVYENRRGDVGGVTVDSLRKKLAPKHSTFVQITSYTGSKVLVHYIHIGQGRKLQSGTSDDICNFDVDRSAIYNMNVYINGAESIEFDSRREYLDHHVIFTYPDVSRVDGHYLDIPAFLSGMNGYVKMQACEVTVDGQGNNVYTPMNDSDPDEKKWLRLSFYNPFRPTAKTSLFSSMNARTDAYSGATPILHFREYIEGASTISGDPKKRTGAIRVGYVSGARDSTEYKQGVDDGLETFFYMPVSQWSIKTIGQVGGYKDGQGYTSLLGVESVEEFLFPYYYRSPGNDVPNNGPVWKYKDGVVNHNQPYDGKMATTDHYNDYRSFYSGGKPPTRRQTDTRTGELYDPTFNSSAADYCMRKNRDENGDGIISGTEIKWYLPTPAQLMQLSIWRDEFNFSFNPGIPFAEPYWSTNEQDEVKAFALDFASSLGGIYTSEVLAYNKTTRLPVRCVRDITGTTGSMIYVSGDHLAISLEGNFPSSMLEDKTVDWSDNQIRSPQGNAKMQTWFLMSRWYVTQNGTRTQPALFQKANNNPNCSNYYETGHPTGTWRLPTQRELAFIYANSGMIDNLLRTNFGAYPAYHPFQNDIHWGSTNDGNNSTFWAINFQSGFSDLYKTGNGYIRCVKYLHTKAN